MLIIIKSKFFFRYLPLMLSVVLVATAGFLWFNVQPARAAIAFVNAGNGHSVTFKAVPITITINATTGNLLYVLVSVNDNGAANCSARSYTVTDNASGGSNTYTQIGSAVFQSFNCTSQFYAKNITGNSSLVVSITGTGTDATANAVVEQFSGLDTSSPLDASASGTAASSPVTSGTFSTAQANEAIVLGDGNYYNATAWTAGTVNSHAMTIDSNASSTLADGNMSVAAEYYIASATQSSVTASISLSGSVYSDFLVATFKAAVTVIPPNTKGGLMKNAKVKIQNAKVKLEPR